MSVHGLHSLKCRVKYSHRKQQSRGGGRGWRGGGEGSARAPSRNIVPGMHYYYVLPGIVKPTIRGEGYSPSKWGAF